MQRMHQSYKCMQAQQETKWVWSQLACSRPRAILRKPIIGIYNPSSIMKNSHQYMKVTTYETLYHEDHGAILKHKCGKGDSSIVPSLSFSNFIFFIFFLSFFSFFGLLFFLFGLSLFFFLFFLFVKSEVSSRLVGESQSSSSFPHWDNALIMKIITLLLIYNSRITTQNQNKI